MELPIRHLNPSWRTVLKLRPWYFLAAMIVFGVISLAALRSNNVHMTKLRDAVYTADKNNGNVEAALRNLRSYVYTHMNTSLASGPNAVHPPIQLKYTYERLQEQQANVLGRGDSALYQEAQNYCDSQTEIGSEVISCIQSYAASHGGTVAPISDSLYKFDFTSTKWSFDLAGWSIVLTVLSFLAFIASLVRQWVVKKL